MNNEPRQVYFDFDNTLTCCDTTLLFACSLAKHDKRFLRLLCFCFLNIIYRLGKISNTQFKSLFTKFFLTGKSVKYVRDVAESFYSKYIKKLLLPDVLEVLKSHVCFGDRVILVSANFDCFLDPLKELLGIDDIICTSAEHNGCFYTGKLRSEACYGFEKLKMVIDKFGRIAVSESIAYGDSPSDGYLLDLAGQSFVVLRPKKNTAMRVEFFRFHLMVLAGKEFKQSLVQESLTVPWERAAAFRKPRG